MAVSETIFTHYITTNTDLRTEVLAWCEENLGDYFDTIDINPNRTGTEIRCLYTNAEGHKSGFLLPVQYTPSGTGNYARIVIISDFSGSFVNINGELLINQSTGLSPTIVAPTVGYKTDYGAAIRLGSTHSLFITKGQTGDTAIFFTGEGDTNLNSKVGGFMDCGAPEKYISMPATTTLKALLMGLRSEAAFYGTPGSLRTSFAPFVFPRTGDYSDGLFVTPFTRYPDNTQLDIITADGVEYVYNSSIALKG